MALPHVLHPHEPQPQVPHSHEPQGRPKSGPRQKPQQPVVAISRPHPRLRKIIRLIMFACLLLPKQRWDGPWGTCPRQLPSPNAGVGVLGTTEFPLRPGILFFRHNVRENRLCSQPMESLSAEESEKSR